MKFSEFFQRSSPIVLDGAMGTLLESRGYYLPPPVWSAAVVEQSPETITEIHREYINAGARIITTATFRTTAYVYARLGDADKAGRLTEQAVNCAREARDDREDLFIAGSVAPLEDCYRPDLVPDSETLYREHRKRIRQLTDAGVDCLLIETMNNVREAVMCAEIAEESGMPFIVSFICESAKSILSGEHVDAGRDAVAKYHPHAVLVNCTSPGVIRDILARWHKKGNIPCGGYANVGSSEPRQGGIISSVLSPEEYLHKVRQWMEYQPSLIGACCGSGPEHIRAISELTE